MNVESLHESFHGTTVLIRRFHPRGADLAIMPMEECQSLVALYQNHGIQCRVVSIGNCIEASVLAAMAREDFDGEITLVCNDDNIRHLINVDGEWALQ
jgi:hypothetical protein